MAGRPATAADGRIGARIHTARQTAGLTQREVALVLGVSAAQMQKYERGSNRVSAATLQAIARVVGRPLTDFFDADDSDDAPHRDDRSGQLDLLACAPAEAA